MDFAGLPPEVNSARMYTGPGAGPLLAAAAAWDELAAALHSAASAYQSEITALTAGPWMGPAAAAMTGAVTPYVAWMLTTAAQAEQVAGQAKAAATAYETAFAETVPPPVIAANRSLLAALVATNIFGQNTAAIAGTEAQYGEMWAQDAAAMYGYAGASVPATTLTAFDSPPQTTSPGGPADQAAAAGQTAGTSAGNVQGAVSSVQQALAAAPNALASLATPAAGAQAAPTGALDTLSGLISVFLDAPSSVAGLGVDTPFAVVTMPFDIAGALSGFHSDGIISGWAGVAAWPGTGAVPPTSFPVITGGSGVAAGLGQANTVGALSVPPGWAVAAPAIRPLAAALPAAGAAAEAATGSAGSMFAEMALASMAGRAIAGTGVPASRTERIRAGKRESLPPQQSPAGGPITGIAAELRELASLRDAGILTGEEFDQQKKRLLGQ